MASSDPKRPNVIVILTDDQGYWAMGCAGNCEIQTPHLDRLAATGTRFETMFCASPVCSPARASLLTGRIPSQHGVHDWLRGGNTTIEQDGQGRLIEYLKGQPGYSDVLAEHGYTCGMSGKWHMGDAHNPQKGFTYWETHAMGGGPYYNAPMVRDGQVYRDERYVTDVITDNGLRFLRQQASAPSPFYLGVHYTAPHSPWDRDNHPAALYEDYHAICPFDSLPREPMHPWQANSAPYGRTEESRRDILSGYFAAVTALDSGVGQILDWLEENNLRESTLIFFTSDNGMNMGHHGIYGKGNGTFPLNMYETSVRVPGLISQPGRIPQANVCDALVSHYDFMPSLLDYLDLPHPGADALPGHSFAPLLLGEQMDLRQDVVVCDEYGPVRMVRTADWKYIHRYPYGPHELYHLAEDPGETRNLYREPGREATIRELRGRLTDWFHQYVDPAVDGVREHVTGKGQVHWAGPAGKGEKAFEDDWFYLGDDNTKPRASFPVFLD